MSNEIPSVDAQKEINQTINHRLRSLRFSDIIYSTSELLRATAWLVFSAAILLIAFRCTGPDWAGKVWGE